MTGDLRAGLPIPADELRTFVLARAAALLDVPPQQVPADRPLADHGLDSISAVALVAEVEDLLHRELDSDLLWEYPTVDGLVAYLAGAHEPGTDAG
ncbi:acyl carrier protein [Plantactinospora endophytica]|uniref:Phosphopantetheine attachment site domain protein n=1 Tax=Plantactinospora endophytica TaxID=673535 RepID=A0ABQ4EBU5_9ACTN|nr:acyl carrier protein [Plantactinospora endophytica]GIG92119.1 phosphopantetheine attachment site domain protein [Plantactinospora endophytica]